MACPAKQAMKASERGELIIGGCMLEDVEFRCDCGATAYDFDDSSADPFNIDDARAYIAEVRWQFAKTMPQWPHEYTVRDWRVDLDDTFVDLSDSSAPRVSSSRGRPTHRRRGITTRTWRSMGGTTGPWATPSRTPPSSTVPDSTRRGPESVNA